MLGRWVQQGWRRREATGKPVTGHHPLSSTTGRRWETTQPDKEAQRNHSLIQPAPSHQGPYPKGEVEVGEVEGGECEGREARWRAYYAANKGRIRERKQRYLRENSHKVKQYYLQNKQRITLQQQAYARDNQPKIRQRKKAYYLLHKDAIKERRRRSSTPEARLKALQSKRDYRLLRFGPRKRRDWSTPGAVQVYFSSAAPQLHVSSPSEWYRISSKQISTLGGGHVISKFGSLGKALLYAFPELQWDMEKFSARGKKSRQRWLRVMLQGLLPADTTILEDYLHPDLLWSDTQRMELDIWVPEYKLAVEYQGEQHYHDLHSAYGPSGTAALYAERDEKKRKSCEAVGITLVAVPYWWDGRAESLASTISARRPDLLPPTDASIIPSLLLKSQKSLLPATEAGMASFLMHGQNYNAEQDPSGWYMSEKLDGVRAFWDGSRLLSKTGNVFSVPLEFIGTLPEGVCLDGELWAGYDSYNKLLSIIRRSNNTDSPSPDLWKEVKFCVFDAPMHLSSYPERYAFAKESISKCTSNITLIPTEYCTGREHLNTKLDVITKKQGEGIMLYHPSSLYTSGRTGNLLKVKAFQEEEVKLIKCNTKSYSYLCQQKNGATCVVQCSGWDYLNPPAPGTVLTVKHNGLFKTSHKLKYPFLLRVRTDISWNLLVGDA